MTSKKKLKTSKKKLKKEINDLKTINTDLIISRNSWAAAAKAAKQDLGTWRAKYEMTQTSPEVKADTENAFKRGQEHARQQISSYLMPLVTGTFQRPDELN